MVMTDVRLVVPGKEYLQSYLEACREIKGRTGLVDRGFFHNPDTYSEWKDTIFTKFEDYRNGRNLPGGYVPASVFWLVENGEFIGEGSIRHWLTPALERFGGHIGYAVRPSRWNQGYGTIQLALLLAEAFNLGIRQALVTCDDDNAASYRVMEKNGGVYQDTIDDVIDGQPRRTRRYRIDTRPGMNLYLRTARLYDLDQRDNLTDDIPFYLDYATGREGETLELACGTGRVSLALAGAGHSVTGLDLSGSMLEIFRQKLAGCASETRAHVSLTQGDMSDFKLNKKFDLIIAPFRAFQALTADMDIEGCLRCVWEHLGVEGRFIVNVFRPNKRLDQSWVYPEAVQWERDDEKSGCRVVKKHWGDKIDTERQIIYPHFAYEVTNPDGVTERMEEELSLKYYYYEQLKYLLISNGFRIIDEFGWYDKSPVENGRELIFVCGR